MAKKLKTQYTLRTECLLNMLHHQWILGYLTCLMESKNEDQTLLIPMDHGGPQTEQWFLELADKIRDMRRRKDGTYYMPVTQEVTDAP